MKLLLQTKFLLIHWWSKGEWSIWKMPHSISINVGRLQFIINRK